jgi:SAM-dependent methyltransferase
LQPLTEQQDAYGHAMRDYLDGYDPVAIVERHDGLVCPDVPVGDYFAPYREWPEHLQQGMEFARGRVLDAGCGAGRVALHLQEVGQEVVGIDISPLAVQVCRERGVEDVRLLAVEDVEAAALGHFDTIVLYGNNFGLFQGRGHASVVLDCLQRILNPGGRLVVESRDPYATEQPYHLAYHERNRTRGRMPGQLRMRIRYLTWATPWFDYLLASPEEVQSILRGTGWTVSRVIRGDSGSYSAVLTQ